MDEHNFVIERKSKPKTPDQAEDWRTFGYYGSLESLLHCEAASLPRGNNAKELLEGIQTTRIALQDALQEAIRNGSLVYDPSVKSERMKEIKARGHKNG